MQRKKTLFREQFHKAHETTKSSKNEVTKMSEQLTAPMNINENHFRTEWKSVEAND